MNWFKHWSKSTYGTCEHDHKLTDPKVKFAKGDKKWLGMYEKPPNLISLSRKAALDSDRKSWTGNRIFKGSDMKWVDSRNKTQRAYDLKGHNLVNKVFLHEMGHYTAMTKNWRAATATIPAGEWQKKYGNRSKTDTRVRTIANIVSSSYIKVEVTATGNYRPGVKTHGNDCIQKYTVVITAYKRENGQKVVDRIFTFNDAWFEKRPKFKWTNRTRTTGTIRGSFEFKTTKKKYKYQALKLDEYNRANDPDDDFIPNEVEDKLGTNWNSPRSHPNHERGDTKVNGRTQVPDQEFWADQYVFDRYDKVEPGKPDKDWANPGAQSNPEYK